MGWLERQWANPKVHFFVSALAVAALQSVPPQYQAIAQAVASVFFGSGMATTANKGQ